MMVLKALIDEDSCIGCTKCLPVCPTDAIVGARKMLHTVIPELCTSCENCIQVCPTECISLLMKGIEITFDDEKRLTQKKQRRLGIYSSEQSTILSNNHIINTEITEKDSSIIDRKQKIADSIARFKQKKLKIGQKAL